MVRFSRPVQHIFSSARALRSWARKLVRRTRANIAKAIRKIIMELPGGLDLPNVCTNANARVGHVTAKYGHRILIWGGYDCQTEVGNEAYHTSEKLDIFNPVTNKWVSLVCNGGFPSGISGATAQVVGDKMYVICGFESQYDEFQEPVMHNNAVYVLDLSTSQWQKLETSGVQPAPCDKLSSWVWQEKIYIFGGFGPKVTLEQVNFLYDASTAGGTRGWNNQCAALNTRTESWEWPICSGDRAPSPRAAHTCIMSGEYMLVFGGRHGSKRLNDLHALHMPTHRWKTLQESTADGGVGIPAGRSWHSLTAVGENRAILYGGYSSPRRPMSDCWHLSWSVGSRGIRNVKWDRWANMEQGPRLWHQAEYSHDTSKIYLLGGVVTDILDPLRQPEHPHQPGSIVASPQSLLELCVLSIAENEIEVEVDSLAIPVVLKEMLKNRLDISGDDLFEPLWSHNGA